MSASTATSSAAAPEPIAAHPLAFAGLILGNAALAIGPMFVRLADTGPVAAAFWRLALALPLLLVLMHWVDRRTTDDPRIVPMARPLLMLTLLGGLFFAADLASWHLGIVRTKVANAALFGNAASLILPVYAMLVAWRLPARTEALALLLAVTGGAVLMGQSYEASRANLVGDLLCLLAGVLYAGYVIALQRARGQLSSWQALTWSTAAGVLPLLVTATVIGEVIWPTNWTPLLLLALCSQVIGQGLLVYALPHFSPLVIGVALLTQPAIGALAGWVAFGERLSGWDVAGGVLIGLALVLIRLPGATEQRRKAL